LTALLAGTFSESSPSNFPWRESMYLKNNHKLDIKKQLEILETQYEERRDCKLELKQYFTYEVQ
jgi:hypothetical protein